MNPLNHQLTLSSLRRHLDRYPIADHCSRSMRRLGLGGIADLNDVSLEDVYLTQTLLG